MLFGVRLRSLFTSRWMALLWATLVMLTAIQFVGVGDDTPAGADNAAGSATPAADGLTNQQRDALTNAF